MSPKCYQLARLLVARASDSMQNVSTGSLVFLFRCLHTFGSYFTIWWQAWGSKIQKMPFVLCLRGTHCTENLAHRFWVFGIKVINKNGNCSKKLLHGEPVAALTTEQRHAAFPSCCSCLTFHCSTSVTLRLHTRSQQNRRNCQHLEFPS